MTAGVMVKNIEGSRGISRRIPSSSTSDNAVTMRLLMTEKVVNSGNRSGPGMEIVAYS